MATGRLLRAWRRTVCSIWTGLATAKQRDPSRLPSVPQLLPPPPTSELLPPSCWPSHHASPPCRWFQEELPAALKDRQDPRITKEELVKLVRWKGWCGGCCSAGAWHGVQYSGGTLPALSDATLQQDVCLTAIPPHINTHTTSSRWTGK